MKTKRRRTPKVGVIFIEKGSRGTLTAHLQRRSSIDQKGRTQKWAHVCISSCEEEIRSDESIIDSLIRKLILVIGQETYKLIAFKIAKLSDFVVFKDKRLVVFAFLVNSTIIKKLLLEPSSDILVPIHESEVKNMIQAEHAWKEKQHGQKQIVVFPEIITAVKNAFDKFNSPKQKIKK